ncbi:hypothetical protein ACI51X_10575 [Pectobacterium versatile]|uniref:hypothetical protein n=1 Tax=Enterobacterales TaxID=91347 RepID=UPI00106560C8|nr:hypothetical protein [Buttiauxella sp. BIGb0552]TDX20277.1 hypothetical protein EDF88_0478 [Buttiauxella sp. BIGb0552]
MPQLKHRNYFQIQLVLSNQGFDGFTVNSLIEKLLQQSDEAKLVTTDRKAIYRTLRAMVERGELSKKISSNPQKSTFHKTSKFILINSKSMEVTIQPVDTVPSVKIHSVSDKRSVNYLESQLKEYQISLLVSIGETEEYKTLFEALPDMRSELEDFYIKAREKSSTLIGQITAINNLLSHCKSAPAL